MKLRPDPRHLLDSALTPLPVLTSLALLNAALITLLLTSSI